METETAPTLPSLKTCLRTEARAMDQSILNLWSVMDHTQIFRLSPETAQRLGRTPQLVSLEGDQTCVWVLKNLPQVAAGAPVSAAYLEWSMNTETALMRLDQAATDLMNGMVDATLLLRMGLYVTNVAMDAAVAGQQGAGARDQGGYWRTEAAWAPVIDREEEPQQRAARTRERLKKLETTVVQPILMQAQDQRELHGALERLLQVAGLLPERGEPRPPAPAPAPADRDKDKDARALKGRRGKAPTT